MKCFQLQAVIKGTGSFTLQDTEAHLESNCASEDTVAVKSCCSDSKSNVFIVLWDTSNCEGEVCVFGSCNFDIKYPEFLSLLSLCYLYGFLQLMWCWLHRCLKSRSMQRLSYQAPQSFNSHWGEACRSSHLWTQCLSQLTRPSIALLLWGVWMSTRLAQNSSTWVCGTDLLVQQWSSESSDSLTFL